MEAQAIDFEKAFEAAEERFAGLVKKLGAEESRRMTHSELESMIAAEGREIHRRLLQGHLDLRAAVKTNERQAHPGGPCFQGVTNPPDEVAIAEAEIRSAQARLALRREHLRSTRRSRDLTNYVRTLAYPSPSAGAWAADGVRAGDGEPGGEAGTEQKQAAPES